MMKPAKIANYICMKNFVVAVVTAIFSIILTSGAYAGITSFYGYQKDDSQEFRKTIDTLRATNQIFNKIYDILKSSKKEYVILTYGEGFSKLFAENSIDFSENAKLFGVFWSEEITSKFSDRSPDFWKKLVGKNIIAFYQSNNPFKLETGEILDVSKPVPPVVFEEFFHAAQFEYYKGIGLYGENDHGLMITFEIEQALAAIYSGIDDSKSRGLREIPFVLKFIEALKGNIKLTTGDVAECESNMVRIWGKIVNYPDGSGKKLKEEKALPACGDFLFLYHLTRNPLLN
jgi:hypothetical protein